MNGFEINLKAFNLSDVLQFINWSKKSGLLKVSGSVPGEIYLDNGLVVHASDGVTSGMEALINLSFVELEKGVFELEVKAPEHTISEDVGKLAENIEKRRIELQELKQKMPPMETVLIKSTRDPEAAVALRRTDWQIIAQIDGKRTLGEIIADSKVGGYEATKTILWLKEQGLIYDPQEAERQMTELIKSLKIFFDAFAGNGLVLMQKWAELDNANKKFLDSLKINEDNFYIQIQGMLDAQQIKDGLLSLEKFVSAEGVKLYGKLLFKKKWDAFLAEK